MQPRELRALIVDDNPADRKILSSILKKLEFRDLQEAEDGSVAENKIETANKLGTPFHVVFLDWQMPRLNGLKLLQYLRGNTKLRNTLVIMTTATADLKRVSEAKASGANDFIVKPFELDVVKAKIEALLSKDLKASGSNLA